MKCVVALAVLAAAGCRSQESLESESVEAHANGSATSTQGVDVSAIAGRSMTVDEFVKAITTAFGCNFTYTATTADEIARSHFQVSATPVVSPGQLDTYLAAELGRADFEFKHVGPDHLQVRLLSRKQH